MVSERSQRIGLSTWLYPQHAPIIPGPQSCLNMYKYLNFSRKVSVDNPLKNHVDKLCMLLWTKVIHISHTVVHTFHPQVISFLNQRLNPLFPISTGYYPYYY